MAQLCQDLENLPESDIEADLTPAATQAGAIVGQSYALLTQAGELIMLQAGRGAQH